MDCAMMFVRRLRVYMAKSHGGMVVCMVLTFGFESRNSMWGHWNQPVHFHSGWKSWQGLLPGTSAQKNCDGPSSSDASPRWSWTFSTLRHAGCIFPGGHRWGPQRWSPSASMDSMEKKPPPTGTKPYWCMISCLGISWNGGIPPNHPFTSIDGFSSMKHAAVGVPPFQCPSVGMSQGKWAHQRLAGAWTSTNPAGGAPWHGM